MATRDSTSTIPETTIDCARAVELLDLLIERACSDELPPEGRCNAMARIARQIRGVLTGDNAVRLGAEVAHG